MTSLASRPRWRSRAVLPPEAIVNAVLRLVPDGAEHTTWIALAVNAKHAILSSVDALPTR